MVKKIVFTIMIVCMSLAFLIGCDTRSPSYTLENLLPSLKVTVSDFTYSHNYYTNTSDSTYRNSSANLVITVKDLKGDVGFYINNVTVSFKVPDQRPAGAFVNEAGDHTNYYVGGDGSLTTLGGALVPTLSTESVYLSVTEPVSGQTNNINLYYYASPKAVVSNLDTFTNDGSTGMNNPYVVSGVSMFDYIFSYGSSVWTWEDGYDGTADDQITSSDGVVTLSGMTENGEAFSTFPVNFNFIIR